MKIIIKLHLCLLTVSNSVILLLFLFLFQLTYSELGLHLGLAFAPVDLALADWSCDEDWSRAVDSAPRGLDCAIQCKSANGTRSDWSMIY